MRVRRTLQFFNEFKEIFIAVSEEKLLGNEKVDKKQIQY